MTNFANTLRIQTILLGLAAALLFGSAARAQEIERAEFADGPFVTSMAQPTPAPASDVTLASVASTASLTETNSQAQSMAVQATDASIVSNVDTSEWTTLAGWAVIAFVIAVALFVRRKIAPVTPAARQNMNNGLSTAKIHAL